jgi:phosphorylase kinase alpha/beta subunit
MTRPRKTRTTRRSTESLPAKPHAEQQRAGRLFPALTPQRLHRQLAQLREKLSAAGTLTVHPNEHGLYAASSSQADDAASGYQNAWLRDNAMVAFSRLAAGDASSAFRTVQGLSRFLQTQTGKIERIISHPELKEEVQLRPHIRFDGKSVRENDEVWPHAQNDALGQFLWLRLLLANEHGFALESAERELLSLLPSYFRAIEYWRDADSGAWEEVRKVNSSSIGAVIAGLREMENYLGSGKSLPGLKRSTLAELAKRGWHTLDAQLPLEAPPERKSDAALLFLIYPLRVVTDARMVRAIQSLVRLRLMGDFGIRRYRGDSYFCQDYDQWFPPQERSADFSSRHLVRDEFLQPGCEAQWCLFDPLLSVIHGEQFRLTGDAASLRLQLEHLNRSIAQLDARGRCPELYYLKQGQYVANEHTPLAWTQANLSLAILDLERSAEKTK